MYLTLGSSHRFFTLGLTVSWIMAVDPALAAGRRVAVAWNDLSGGGRVQARYMSQVAGPNLWHEFSLSTQVP